MIFPRPFHVRPYTKDEMTKWFGSPVLDKPSAPLRRVIVSRRGWDERWDLWAKGAILTGALIPPRRVS